MSFEIDRFEVQGPDFFVFPIEIPIDKTMGNVLIFNENQTLQLQMHLSRSSDGVVSIVP